MPLSKTALSELRQEYDELIKSKQDMEARLRVLDGRIRALKEILEWSPALPTPSAKRRGNGRGIIKTGFRAALVDVLAKHPTGLRPKEIADELIRSGFKPPASSTRFQTRVSTEAWRLMKNNELKKLPDGRYTLNS